MKSSFDDAIVFTGHMIDAPGRKAERFPARAEDAAREAILRAVEGLIVAGREPVGIAGGASGGDLLFHEVCAGLGVPTRLRLALPVEEYLKASVAPAGEEWVVRFHALVERLGAEGMRVLNESVLLPEWLTGGAETEGAEVNVWARTNLWMVNEAIGIAPHRTLLALWDGKAGDGPGGTEHLVKAAPGFGMDVGAVIRTQDLFR